MKNIKLLYLYSFFTRRPFIPIITTYYLYNNISLSQIGILASVTFLVQILTEIHGGIFADKNGRRISLMIHSFLGLVSGVLLYIGSSFPVFLLASIFYGFAGAFITGTTSSLLFDTLKEQNLEKSFKKYSGNILFFALSLNAITLLVVPYLYSIDKKLPLIITCVFFTLSLFISYLMEEPSIAVSNSKLNYFGKVKSAFKFTYDNKNLFILLVIASFSGSFIFIIYEYIQPYLSINGVSVAYFGLIYAFMRVLSGIGGKLAHLLESTMSTHKIITISIIAITISSFMLSIGENIIYIGIMLLALSEGLNSVSIADEVNQNVVKDRTTILSLFNFSKSLVFTMNVVIFGYISELYSIQSSIFIFACLFLLICVLVLISTAFCFRRQ